MIYMASFQHSSVFRGCCLYVLLVNSKFTTHVEQILGENYQFVQLTKYSVQNVDFRQLVLYLSVSYLFIYQVS